MKKIKILIVEDQKEIINNYIKFIKPYYMFDIVGIAMNGEEAISLIKIYEIDVIILDIIMNKLDGIEVIKYINMMETKKPKIIITSLISDTRIIRECYQIGAFYYLLKPFDFKILKREIMNAGIDEKYCSTTQNKIDDYLQLLGVPIEMKGYEYIKEAINLILIKKDNKPNMSYIYDYISKNYEVNSKSVEKAIRICIEATFTRGDIDEISKIFKDVSFNITGKVSNKKFIYKIASKI